MRYIFFITCLLFTLSYADGVKKIELIVKDIAKLRSDYNTQTLVLKTYKLKIQTLKTQNKQLKQKIHLLENKKKCKKYVRVNPFPDLKMKHTYRYIKALSFRLKRDANIYSTIRGIKLFKWEKGTSFTSNVRSDGWIKITGYFVNKIWKKSQKDLWVDMKDTIVRK